VPDFTVEIAATCAQNVSWVRTVPSATDPRKTYVVRWGRTYDGDFQFGWSCTCKAFQRCRDPRKKACKHIEAVKHERCTWNNHLEPGYGMSPTDCCPDCKGPLEFMRVAA